MSDMTFSLGDPAKMREEIIERAAEDAANWVRECVRDETQKEIKRAVSAAFDAAVAGEVRAAVDAFMAEPVRRTDTYGSAKGEPKTMREHVVDAAREGLSVRVDDHGRPSSYGDRCTYGEWLIKKVAEGVVHKEFVAELKKSVEAAHARIAADVSAAALAAVQAKAAGK